MLFLESKALNHAVDRDGRTRLLQELQERGMVPLIRSHRLRCFEDVLLGMDRVEEMEKSLAASTESTIGEPFVIGDLFCFEDHILFLVFEDDDAGSYTRAGIVYEAHTPEPFRKLDAFCQEIGSLMLSRDPRFFPAMGDKRARHAAGIQIVYRAPGRRFALHKSSQGNDEQADSGGVET